MQAFHIVVRKEIPCFCGPSDGGNYDMSHACRVCGSGAKRLDPIQLPKNKLVDFVSITYIFEFIIPPRLVKKIKDIAPNCLRVIHDKNNEPTEYFQLIPSMSLPRFAQSSTGWCTEGQCASCKRDGYFNVVKEPLKLIYSKPTPSFHVAETFECFGNSKLKSEFKKSHFANGNLLVSQPIAQVLKDEKGLEFVPIIFGD